MRTFVFFICVVSCAIAAFLPGRPTAELLAGENTARLPFLLTGTWIFRGSLLGMAGVLWLGVSRPGWFKVTHLPTQLLGIRTERSKTSWQWLIPITLVATVLRFIALGRDLWIDEISTLTQFSQLPLYQTITQFLGANQHPLYTTLANISVSWWGVNESAVRIPAVLFGIGGVVALYYFARLLTDEREAIWATALLALSYHHIWFSQNARGWIGLLFFSLVTSWLFLQGLAHNRTRTWLLYSLATALSILLHLNTLFIFLGQLTAYLLILPRWGRVHWPMTRRLVWVGALTASLTLLFHSFILPDMIDYYVNTFYDGANIGWTNPLAFLAVFAQGVMAGFLGIGAIVVGSVFLAGLVSFVRQGWILLGLLVFPAGYTLLAIMGLSIGAYPRHFLYVLPIALILAVRGAVLTADWLGERVSRWKPAIGTWFQQKGATALLALVAIASLLSLIPYYRIPKQSYQATLAYVESQKQPEDVVAAVGLAAPSYRALYGPHLLFPETIADLQAVESETHTTWVIYTFQRDMRIRFSDLYDYLEENYTIDTTFPGTVGDGTLWVVRLDER